MSGVDKPSTFVVDPASYSSLLGEMDAAVEAFRVGLRGHAEFFSATKRVAWPDRPYVEQDDGNANWAAALSAIGDIQKDLSATEDKRSLAAYRYLPPKRSLGVERARHLLRGVARLYAFLTPTPEMLAACERLTNAAEESEFQASFVIGDLLFAAASRDSWHVEDLVRVPLRYFFSLQADTAALGSYARFGIVTGSCLQPLLLGEGRIDRFFGAWNVICPGLVPIAAWLSLDAVSRDLVPQKRSAQGRRGKAEKLVQPNAALAKRALWRERHENPTAFETDTGEVMREFNAALAKRVDSRGAARHLNVLLDSAARLRTTDPATTFFYSSNVDALTWGDEALLPLSWTLADADLADQRREVLRIRGSGPKVRVAFESAAPPDFAVKRPAYDPLDFALELARNPAVAAATEPPGGLL